MSNFQLQDITLFNDNTNLSLKGSWICFQTQMQKSVIHRVLSFHVETVCLLSKLSEAKNHIRLKVDMDEMDVTAAENKGIYREIQEWVQEKKGQAATVSGGKSGSD